MDPVSDVFSGACPLTLPISRPSDFLEGLPCQRILVQVGVGRDNPDCDSCNT